MLFSDFWRHKKFHSVGETDIIIFQISYNLFLGIEQTGERCLQEQYEKSIKPGNSESRAKYQIEILDFGLSMAYVGRIKLSFKHELVKDFARLTKHSTQN